MMIKEVAPGLTTIINPGRLAYIITLDKYGLHMDYSELAAQAKHFSYIVIQGDDPFKQKDDVAKFIKKVVKDNPKVQFEIFCMGEEKPISLGGINNINYYVNLQLKRTNIPFDKRIKNNVITWFYQADATFMFSIKNEDELDEVDMIITDNAIPKSKVFIGPDNSAKLYNETLDYILRFIKIRGYNYFFNLDKIRGIKI